MSGQQWPPDVYRVLNDARLVRQRVDRLLQALIMTAESVAAAVEDDVFAHSECAADYEHLARTARADAALYRELQQRLRSRDT